MSERIISEPSAQLKAKVEYFRRDFLRNEGRSFEHFFCPILHADEATELCEGHIIPEALGERQWVPQRRDVDNFFGSIAEAGFISVTQERESDPIQILRDKKLSKHLWPRIRTPRDEIDFYHATGVAAISTQHCAVRLTSAVSEAYVDLAWKVDAGRLKELTNQASEAGKLEIVIEQDQSAESIASLLKAAHLSMFRLFGYRWVFSIGGDDLAQILRKFYLENRQIRKRDISQQLRNYFGPHESMIRTLGAIDSKILGGTMNDRRILALVDDQDRPFVVGVVVKAGHWTFAVLTPASAETINTYFSFLKCPSSSVAVCILEWRGDEWQTVSAHRVAYKF